jgi:hypothetical protein
LKKKKRTAVRAILLYLILTAGSWMFIKSYTNSYNRLTGENIAPASLDLNGSKASVSVLEHSTEIDLTGIFPESRLYYAAYLLSPDEVRAMAHIISFCNGF